MLKSDQNSDAKAFDLFIEGFSVEDIAIKLKIDPLSVASLVSDGRISYARSLPHTLTDRQIDQLSALNKLIFNCYFDLNNSNDVFGEDGKLYRDGIKSRNLITQTLLKLLQEKAKLLGLNDPLEIA
ncbi:MAG: hypothetical protein ACRC80_11900, partial [Waterburya sp.]